jgi:uncharacterized protein
VRITCAGGEERRKEVADMPEGDAGLVSVRGEARATVPPDSAELPGSVEAVADTKAAALRAVATALDDLTGALASLGGVPLDAQSTRAPLTWSAHSASTRPEFTDKRTGEYVRTGRSIATVSVLITVRDFGLLGTLGDQLATLEPFRLYQVSWQVDWDNSAWARLRADAIRAAVAKARDYVRTLGGELSGIDHIADSGMLSAGDGELPRGMRMSSSSGRGEGDWPDLDPPPQDLRVMIEARFTARGMAIGPGVS